MSSSKGLIAHFPLREVDEKVGNELITNGGFDSAGANWGATGESTVNTGVGRIYSSVGAISTVYQLGVKTIGKSYRITLDIIGTSSGSVQIGNAVTEGFISAGLTGRQVFTIVAGETALYFKRHGVCDTSIDNVSIKEIETADNTPNANHGTVYGATQNSDDMSFDGTDDYVDFGSGATGDLINNASAMSFSVWVTPNTDSGSIMMPISNIIDSTSNGFNLRLDNSGVNVYQLLVGGRSIETDAFQFHTSSGSYSINTTHHVVGILNYSGDEISLYVDGVFEGTTSVTFGANTYTQGTPTTNDSIGGKVTASLFSGTIKDIKIYNRALSATEIQSLYDLGGRQNNISTGSLYKGLVLDMPLREDDEKVGAIEYESDFTSNNDGFGQVRGNISGNIDSITDDNGRTEDNTLRYYADSTNSSHYVNTQGIAPGLTEGKSYKLAFSYYIPSGQTHVDRLNVQRRIGGAYTASTIFSTVGEWQDVVTDWIFIGQSTWNNNNRVDFYQLDGLSSTFAGANIITDDLMYFKNVRFIEVKTADNTPNGNHGTNYGATQNTNDMTFNGLTSYLQISHDTKLLESFQNGFTYVGKARFESTGEGNFGRIIDNSDDASGINGWYVRANGANNNLAVRIDGGNTVYSATDSVDYSGTNEYHIAVTFDTNGTISFYVDGELSGTPSIAKALSNITTTSDIYIGDSELHNYSHDGEIKDVKLYNRALTSDEIERLYKEGL